MLSYKQLGYLFLYAELNSDKIVELKESLSTVEREMWDTAIDQIRHWSCDLPEFMHLEKRRWATYQEWKTQKLDLFRQEFSELEDQIENVSQLEKTSIEDFKRQKNNLDSIIRPFNKKEQERIKKHEWPTFSKALWLGLKSSSAFKEECLSAVKAYENAVAQKERVAFKKSELLNEKSKKLCAYSPSVLNVKKDAFLEAQRLHAEMSSRLVGEEKEINRLLNHLVKSPAIEKYYKSCAEIIVCNAKSSQMQQSSPSNYMQWWSDSFKEMSILILWFQSQSLFSAQPSSKINISRS